MIKAEEIATKLLLDFNEKIKDCENVDDYVTIVVGIFTFSKLVEENFSELFRKDSPEGVSDALNDLHLAARSLANAAIEKANAKKKTDLTIN